MRARKYKSHVNRVRRLWGEISERALEVGREAHEATFPDGSVRAFADDAGVPYRRLMYLVNVHRAVLAGKITEVEAKKIGWTKAAVIATLPVRAPSLIKAAATLSVPMLKARINGVAPKDHYLKTFRLSATDSTELDHGLNLFGWRSYARGSGVSRDLALMLMVREAVKAATRTSRRVPA